MKNSKALSITALIAGAVCAILIVLNPFGLDNYAGWGRLRIISFTASMVTVAFSTFFLLFSSKVIAQLNRWKQNPLISNLIKSQSSVFFRKYSFILPMVIGVILLYIWLASSGTWIVWNSPTRYYANLAKGFAYGKLYIPGKPDPKLVELPNPYDPLLRRGIDVPIDLSYYNGKYYLYWGPVPALMLVPLQSIYPGRVGDLQLTFVFTCGIFLLLSALITKIWDVYFSSLPKWLLRISILLIGIANLPALFMLNNHKGAKIYEAAITGGQFFLIGGLLIVITVVKKPSQRWKLILTGTLWALSICTRLTLALPIGAMVFTLVCSWLLEKERIFEKIFKTLSLTAPIIFGFILLGWYNWARFGSVTESGLYYQLAVVNLQQYYDILFSPVYFFQNLYNYTSHPFGVYTQFPFVQVEYGRTISILSSYNLPDLYNAQQTTGVFLFAPFLIYTLVPFVQLLTKNHKNHQKKHNTFYWIVLMLGSSLAAAFIFLTFFFWSAIRYVEDFMPSLLALSIIGFWQGYMTVSHTPFARKIYTVLGVSLATVSLFLSLLLAISINDARFGIIQFLTH